jgi:hypothetical protein
MPIVGRCPLRTPTAVVASAVAVTLLHACLYLVRVAMPAQSLPKRPALVLFQAYSWEQSKGTFWGGGGSRQNPGGGATAPLMPLLVRHTAVQHSCV